MTGPGRAPAPDTRLIIVEGLMGTGKSTTCRWLAGQLRGNGFPVTVYGNPRVWGRAVPDAFRQAIAGRPHSTQVWDRLGPDDLVHQSRAAWGRFVADATLRTGVSLFDGRFFHADLAGLLMMDAPHAMIEEHALWIADLIRPLHPRFVYLHPGDTGAGLRRITRRRGRHWGASLSSPVRAAPFSRARMESPYFRHRGLAGAEGVIAFYRDYVNRCDLLLPQLSIPCLRLETQGGDWGSYRAAILEFLGLSPVRDFGYLTWWVTKRPRMWISRALGDLRAGGEGAEW